MTTATTTTTAPLSLVTGANGHLGNTLVRALLARGHRVRAGVRDLGQHAPFEGVDCERVYAELRDHAAMRRALEGVDVLYQVAAVFKHWARDPQAEIIEPNVQGTRTVLRAAAEAGVKKVVYVSSVAAVGHNGQALTENDWNDEQDNAYYVSKIQSEFAAWELARTLGLDMVAILPSAMVGPHAFRLTDTMRLLEMLMHDRLPLDPGFHFNFVDVRDVAEGAIDAAMKGRPGHRYILANARSSSLPDMIAALNAVQPGHKPPMAAPRWLIMAIAGAQEAVSRLTGRPAELLRSQVRLFHGVRQEYRLDKARAELGYRPRPPELALQSAFQHLLQQDGIGLQLAPFTR